MSTSICRGVHALPAYSGVSHGAVSRASTVMPRSTSPDSVSNRSAYDRPLSVSSFMCRTSCGMKTALSAPPTSRM